MTLRKIGKRVLSLLLLLSVLAGFLPADVIVQASAEELHEEGFYDSAIDLTPVETGEESAQAIVENGLTQDAKAVTPAPANYTSAIFIDFKNASADQTRYNTAAYTKKNFDTENYWNVNNNGSTTGTITMDNANGKLTAKPGADSSALVIQPSATGANDPGAPFSYSTANAEVLMYKMKIKNLKSYTSEKARVCFDIYNGSTKASVGDVYITAAQIAGTADVVVTMELPPSVRSLGTMTKFRWYFADMAFSTNTSVEVDYIYIGPKSGLSATVYGHTYHFRGEAEGQATNWTLNNITGATFDTANSILKGTGAGDAQLVLKTPLNHTIESTDIMEVRLKTSAATKVYFFYATTDGLGYGNTTTSGSPEETTAGAYTTVKYSFASGNVGKTITTFRIDPVDTSGHTFEIDYIYIGPSDKAPSKYLNKLLFDFDQTEEGDRRYTSEYYGDRDYNSTYVTEDELGKTGVWYINGNQVSGISMSGGNMTVTHEATMEKDFGYIGTANSLRYPTNSGDIVQVRIKFVDMAQVSGHNISLRLYGRLPDTTGNSVDETSPTVIPCPTTFANDTWYTLRADLNSTMVNAEFLTAARIQWGGMISATGKTGKAIIDYIYIGNPDDAPGAASTYKISYHDGVNLLTAFEKDVSATKVSNGDSAGKSTYSISNKVVTIKNSHSNEVYHYFDQTFTLTANKTYHFSCDTSGTIKGTVDAIVRLCDSSGNPTGTAYTMSSNSCSFTPTATGTYKFRFDVNTVNATHTFSNIKLVEQSVYDYSSTSGSTAKSEHNFGVAKDLTSNGYSRAGYTFKGWSTTKGASTATYTDASSVSNLSNLPGDTVVLYAVWEPTSIYMDFTNDAAAQYRYAHAAYGNYNFDTATQWHVEGDSNNNKDSIATADPGTMIIQWPSTSNYIALKTSINNTTEGSPLSFSGTNFEVVQMRMKLEDVTYKSGAFATMDLYVGSTKIDLTDYALTQTQVQGGDWFIVTIPIPANLRSSGKVTSIRPMLQNMTFSSSSKWTIDYIYIGTENGRPSQDYLFFDFTNTDADKERYSTDTYGKLNFDEVSNWCHNWRANSLTMNNTEPGTLSFSISSSVTDAFTFFKTGPNMNALPLNYTPGPEDCIQIRMKIENAVATATPHLTIVYKINDDSSTEYRMQADFTSAEVNGEYFVVTFDADDTLGTFRSAKKIMSLRPMIVNVASATGNTAKYTIDWIYVGKKSGLPSQERLFFDFTNTAYDQKRYSTDTYGGLNFDLASNWWRNTDHTGDIVMDNSGIGTMSFSIKSANAENYYFAGTGVEDAAMPLNYKPGSDDYVQVRLKIDGAVATGTKPHLTLIYAIDNDTVTDPRRLYGWFTSAELNGEYFILTFAADSTFRSAEKIKSIRPMIVDAASATGKTASFTFDWICIADRKELPTPVYIVTFCNPDGTVLKTVEVLKGEDATYSGTPTKAYDGTYHYTFNGWDKSLSNITADTTITAKYTATAHSYTYKVTKNPTTSATGTLTGTCTVGGTSHTVTVTLPKLNTTDYTKNTKAATCTDAGYDRYTWKTTTYGTFYFDVAIAALNHNYNKWSVTKAPTTSATGTLTGTCANNSSHTTMVTLPVLNTTAYTYKVEKAATCTALGVGRYTWNTKTYGTFYFDVDIPMIAHSYTSKVTAPTCTAQGYTTYTCSACGHSYKDNYVNATGHVNTSTKTTDATCTSDGSVIVTCACGVVVSTKVVAALGHDYSVKVNTVSPNCGTGAQGYTVYKCSRCTATENRDYVTAKHTEETMPAVAATCTNPGKTEGKKCSVCNTVLTAQREVPATGHTEVIDKAVPATCTTTGLTEGKHCSVCNAVLTAQTTVAALSHDYSVKVNTVSPNCGTGAQGYTVYKCSRCTATENRDYVTAKHTEVTIPAVAATCTTPGKTEGKKCSVCNTVLTAQREVPATGHTEVIDKAVPATCTTTGLTEGKHCSVCGEVLVAQETIAALGHTEAIDDAVEPTCTETGLTEGSHCSVCNEVLVAQQVIDAWGHSEVTDEAVEPTCTATGLTAGSHCDVCGEIFVAQTEIPATGHSYAAPVNNGNGTHSSICHCGDAAAPEQHEFDSDGFCICGASNKVGSLEADPIDVVIDYGKPIEVSVRDRAFISAVTEEMLAEAPMTAALANPADSVYGTVEAFDSDNDGLDDSVRFTPTGILRDIVTVNCVFKVYFITADVEQDVIVPVRIVPATSVYYETDFSDTAFKMHVYGSEEEKYQWQIKGESTATGKQDNGTVKENIYDFVFDRGGDIPGNAFFADFTNDDAAIARYSKDSTYARSDNKYAYTNFDLSGSWSGPTTAQTAETVDTAAGTLSFTLTDLTRNYAWVQASLNSDSGYWLSYHPQADHYFQVRFKIKNAVGTGENGVGEVHMLYYTGGNANSELFNGGMGTIPAQALSSGEYVTVSFPLSKLGDHTKISALRLHFGSIKSADGSNPEFTVDYIYCGPDNRQNDAAAINPEYALTSNIPAADYLFYDFTGSGLATERYASAQYDGSNYDSGSRWVVSTSTTNGSSNAVHNVTYSSTNGTIGPNIARKMSGSTYVCYVAPSDGTKEDGFPYIGSSYNSLYTLNYTINRSQSYVCIIRFKFVNCKQNGTPQVNCTLVDEKYTAASNTSDGHQFAFSSADNKYYEARINLNNGVKNTQGKIRNFYIRFSGVTNKDNVMGKVVIDYIYIGPAKDTVTDARRAESNSVFVDFNNTTHDQTRYAGHVYGGVNFDNNSLWVKTNCTSSIGSGILTVKPSAASGRLGVGTLFSWGDPVQYCSVRDAMMNYPVGSNYCAVVRMKHTDVINSGTPKLEFTVSNSDTYDSSRTVLSKNLNVANDNGKWVTYVIDLSSYSGKTIKFFQLGFSGVSYNSNTKFEFDYVYIGPKLNAAPPEDTIYFGFENTGADQTRYSSATYGNINYDDPANVNKFGLVNLASASIDNINGTMTMVALSGKSTFGFSIGNTLQYHPKDKTVQMRFKLKDFVLYGNSDPCIFLQYGDNDTEAGPRAHFSKEYLTNGKYVTVTLDLTEADAANFNKQNTTNKMRFIVSGIKNADNTQGKITLDYAYIGPKDGKLGGELTYGYDSTYTSGYEYSGGSSYFVEGLGVPVFNTDGSINTTATKAYTESTFIFTGTGFDIISRTGQQQGLVRAMIYKQDGTFVKSVQALNKSDVNLDFCQIPVMSVEIRDKETDELVHDTYTVKLYVAAAYDYDDTVIDFGGMLDRGGEFYFDAIRIHNTVDTNAGTEEAKIASKLYGKHGEANAFVEEIRQLLLEAESFNGGNTEIDGIVYLDKSGTAVSIDTYREQGPNNEVYLDKDHAISFRLEAAGAIPASVDIGAKAAGSTPTGMLIATGTQPTATSTTGQSFTIATATQQNYALKIAAGDWKLGENGKYYTYITISNSGEGVLSLTDVKCAYDSAAAASPVSKSIRFLASGDLLLPPLDDTPTEDSSLTFGAQLYLENDLTMAFRVRANKLAAYDLSTAYLVVERDIYESGAKEAFVETTIISEYAISDDGRLVFSYPGIAAAQMNDAIRATLYIKDANGKEYVSPVLNTSVATYLDGLLSNSASDTKLVTLIMDMVNYGAAAQVYFDRHADAPVNEEFESFKTYASYASADFTTALENLSVTTDSEGKSGKLNLGLDLGTRIGIQYKVTVPADVNVEDVTLVITDADGNELETLQVAGNSTDDRGRYIVNFYGSTSRDMRRVVYATAYANGEAITGTYAYSISTYAWGVQQNAAIMDAKLVSVTRAMMLYGDSASAYFAN